MPEETNESAAAGMAGTPAPVAPQSAAAPPEISAQPPGAAGPSPLIAGGPSTAAPQPPKVSAKDIMYHGVGKLYHSVLDVLGGKSNQTVSYDPDTGQRKVVETPRKPGEQWATILAGALTGLAAGSKEHGPGAGLASFGAGVEATTEQAKEARERREAMATKESEMVVRARQAKASAAMADQQVLKALHENAQLSAEFASKYATSDEEIANAVNKEGGTLLQGPGPGGSFSKPEDIHAFAMTPQGKEAIASHAGGYLKIRPFFEEILGPDGKPTGQVKTSYKAVMMPKDWATSRNANPEEMWISNPNFDKSKPVSDKNPIMKSVIALPGSVTNQDLETNKKQKLSIELSYEKEKAAIAQAEAETQKAKAEAGKAAAETGKIKEETEQLKSLGINVPANFVPAVNAFSMSPDQLKNDLESKGIPVPSVFPTLWGIGHYKDDLTKNFTARPMRGTGGMNASQATSFIRTFINPNFDEKNYPAVANLQKEFASTRNGTAGGNLIAFNTATAHLGALYAAGKALKTNDVQAINKIAQAIGVQTGKSPKLTFDAIRNALVGELGKTFKGASPDVPEQKQILDGINSAQSPDQLMNVAKTYAHLMLSKAYAQDNRLFVYTGEHAPGLIDPKAKAVYDMMGIALDETAPPSVGSVGAPPAAPQAGPAAGGAGLAPAGATNPVFDRDGKTLIGHVVNGKYVPLAQSHQWSASAWLKANPGGNVEDAKAQAKAKGFTVVE